MFQVQFRAASTEEFYTKLREAVAVLSSAEQDWLANLSNAAALIGLNMERINWAGFYLLRKDELVLGPFWGKPACTRIPLGSGVCGTAAATLTPQVVDDVDLFEGHIACDSDSRSEIVIPFMDESGALLGVLDIDSPDEARFTSQDLHGLSRFIDHLVQASEWVMS